MHFVSSAFAVAGAALVATFAAQPAAAADNRILVSHSTQNGTDFCNSWRCACVNYVPQDPSLYFKATLCEPGNYHGKNTTQEARVYCTFTTNGQDSKSIFKHVAAQTGAKAV